MQTGFLIALVLVASLGFARVVEPFFGAIVWAVVVSIMFTPLNNKVTELLGGRRSLAALLTLNIILGLVIIPAIILTAVLLQQASGVYAQFQSGSINFDKWFITINARLPSWAHDQLVRAGLTDLAAVRAQVSAGLASSFRTLAAQAFSIGQGALSFLGALTVMLYLTFFMLRDGYVMAAQIERAIPLRHDHRRAVLKRFTDVIRATVKGSLVVAILQGLIGGIIFFSLGIGGATLWGVTMGLFSLLPAIGTGIVWVPVAIYLLATGAIWQGVTLALCGFFIISSVDNVVRPILVGRETRMPDYIVLISTLGGLALFGFNGLVVGPVIAAAFLGAWEIFTQTQEANAEADADADADAVNSANLS